MRSVVIAPRAQRQVDNRLRHSEARFGPSAAERYRTLILTAIDLLREAPEHPAATPAPVGRAALMLHLRHVRRRLAASERVASPRHLIVYRFTQDRLDVVQVLDDRMELVTRLK